MNQKSVFICLAGFAVGWIITGSILGAVIFATVMYFRVYLPYFAKSGSDENVTENRHDWGAGFKQLKENFDARRELSKIEGLLKERGAESAAPQSRSRTARSPKPVQKSPSPNRSNLPDNSGPVIQRSRFGW